MGAYARLFPVLLRLTWPLDWPNRWTHRRMTEAEFVAWCNADIDAWCAGEPTSHPEES